MSKQGKKRFSKEEISWRCRLKVFRAEFDMTQEDVAEKLNVSRQTISSIEKGKYNPSLILAYKIANLFKVPIDKMFKFENKKKINEN